MLIRVARRMAMIVLALLAFAVAAELACRALPVSTSTQTGYYVDPEVLTYPPRFTWQVSTGWDLRNPQVLHSNNLGFAAHRDFVPDEQAVALVGDSYVEASMLAPDLRPGVQLEAALQGRPVYPLGGPGSSLLDYAERIRLATQRLGVHDVVVFVEVGDLLQSRCGSGNVHSQCLDPQTLVPRQERHPPPPRLKIWLRQSAFAQYLFSQLRADPQRLLKSMSGASVGASPASASAPAAAQVVAQVTQDFFDRVGKLPSVRRLVLVVDGSHDSVRAPLSPETALQRQQFMALARQRGATIVDTEVLYASHYAKSARSLNVAPFDRHLNGIGVRLVMQAAADALR